MIFPLHYGNAYKVPVSKKKKHTRIFSSRSSLRQFLFLIHLFIERNEVELVGKYKFYV